MICQFCEIDYPPGTERCARCGCDLVESLPAESAEIVLEPLGEIYRRRQLDFLVERLQAAAIPYVVHSGTALRMQESQALSDMVHSSQWEARIMVVSSRHEEARAAMVAAAELMLSEPDEPEVETEGAPEGPEAFGFGPFEKISPR